MLNDLIKVNPVLNKKGNDNAGSWRRCSILINATVVVTIK